MGYKEATSKWNSIVRKTQKENVVKENQNTSPRVSRHPESKHALFAERYCKAQQVLGPEDQQNVFLAYRKSDNVCVAVKRFDKARHCGSNSIHGLKVQAEFLIGSQLRHVNTIRMLDLFLEPNGEWLQVMEYAPHQLFDRVQSGQMSTQEMNCSFSQIIAGVNYLHGCGFAHRDLKLENIVYTRRGVMKIIDFGAATTCETSSSHPVLFCNDYVGTLPYMAPEMVRRGFYDPRCTDVWSLAILYCCMLLKKFPWKKASPLDREFADFVTILEANAHGPNQIPTKTAVLPIQTTTVTSDQEHQRRGGDSCIKKESAACVVVEIDLDPMEASKVSLSQRLPEEMWPVIGAMLRMDYQTRATLPRIMDSSWFKRTQSCAREGGGSGLGSCSHTHT